MVLAELCVFDEVRRPFSGSRDSIRLAGAVLALTAESKVDRKPQISDLGRRMNRRPSLNQFTFDLRLIVMVVLLLTKAPSFDRHSVQYC